jgi:hypothetical protein
MNGLHSPLHDGHLCGLNPDAKAEQVPAQNNSLYILCQVI